MSGVEWAHLRHEGRHNNGRSLVVYRGSMHPVESVRVSDTMIQLHVPDLIPFCLPNGQVAGARTAEQTRAPRRAAL